VPRRRILYIAALVLTAILSSVLLSKNIDFMVYWFGVRYFLDHVQPLYGPEGGALYPQEFRYPPVTVLFFALLTDIPFRLAGVVWNLLTWAICTWATMLAIRKWKPVFTPAGILMAAILAAPYAYLAVKFGNVQAILTALVLLALVWCEDHADWAGIALALAICFKVWPLFFALWFLIPSRRKALYWTAAVSAALWIVPVAFFGFAQYRALLRDFLASALSAVSHPEELWYSSQSLRGVLLRFLTHSVALPADYPDLSFAGLPVNLVVGVWVVLSVAATGFALRGFWRSPGQSRFLWDALAFVLCAALQPYTFNNTLILLGPAILVGAHVYSAGWSRASQRAYLGAAVLSGLGMLMFTSRLVHVNLMWGIHLWIALALGWTLVSAAGESVKKNVR